jgi:hypothetical protein
MLRWRSAALLTALVLVALASVRLYYGPLRTLEPMGRCIKGAIDLNNPVPFAQPRFGGTVVGIASSGGASRAAYLSAAVLREIRRSGATLMLGASSDPMEIYHALVMCRLIWLSFDRGKQLRFQHRKPIGL